MHELPVTKGIISLAVETAEKHNAARVTAIDIVIGAMSSIVDDSVQFYFDILSEGTITEGAVLRFKREPSQAVCWDCGHTFEVTPPIHPACPSCGSPKLHVTSGKEFHIESIEVEHEDPSREKDPQRE
jgi:hydrogenase nickel incorporation protein HypA/HybF